MRLICTCDNGPGCMLGSPLNPVWQVRLDAKSDAILIHFQCASDEIKKELGCPCDCHLTVNTKGEPMLSNCSFCPVSHDDE